MDCPQCGLVNSPEAQRCDCGYDFVSKSVQASYSTHAVRESWGRRRRPWLLGLGASALAGLDRGLGKPEEFRQLLTRRSEGVGAAHTPSLTRSRDG